MFLSAILSSVLLWAAFFPLNFGPLAFVALAPWLTLVRAQGSNRRRYLAAYVGGLVFFLLALQWVPVAHRMMYFSWIALSLACPLFWVAALYLIRRLDRLGVPLSLSAPVAWVAMEYTRAHFPTGFPFLQHLGLYQMVGFGWYFLGYTQHEFLSLIQTADLGGVYAVSFVVASVNGALLEWALRLDAVRVWLGLPEVTNPPVWRMLPGTGFAAVLTVGTILYGVAKLDHAPFAKGPRVAAIQGSVPQEDKNKRGLSERLVKSYRDLYVQAVSQSPTPDLIVWPETCCVIDWFEPPVSGEQGGVPAWYMAGVVDSLKLAEAVAAFRTSTNVLLGLNGYEWHGDREWKFNSAVLVSPSGAKLGRYDKMHLVPFGEYVPFKDTLPFMSVFTPYKHDYSCRPGEHWTRFPLQAGGKSYTFGCLICYEDSDPYLARQYVAAEPVDFVVNISNDGWFDGTEEHEQHLAICCFRAVEARRSIVRSVNMGISCVIDPDGRVIALPGQSWSSSKKVEGVVTAAVPIDDRPSRYAKYGDWIPAVCWALLVLGVGLSMTRLGRIA